MTGPSKKKDFIVLKFEFGEGLGDFLQGLGGGRGWGQI